MGLHYLVLVIANARFFRKKRGQKLPPLTVRFVTLSRHGCLIRSLAALTAILRPLLKMAHNSHASANFEARHHSSPMWTKVKNKKHSAILTEYFQ
ncbi:hypothetical protein ACLUWT_06945, partial [Limosilactobacillus mucosae]